MRQKKWSVSVRAAMNQIPARIGVGVAHISDDRVLGPRFGPVQIAAASYTQAPVTITLNTAFSTLFTGD
jgi:hypothetical protein